MAEIKDLLPKLNRMRENAGMKPLKSWKASKDKLQEKIDDFKEQGIPDTLPGANVEVDPKTDDPKLQDKLPEKPVTKIKPGLGRGVENDLYGRQCREKIKDHRRREREEAKAERKSLKKGKVELSEEDKAAIKEEAEFRGKVDPKKDPEKAERQKKHVERKKAARKASGRKTPTVADNEITVADLARDLGKSPKIVRAKLRRYEDQLRKDFPETNGRWVFPKKAIPAIKKIIG